jgi:AmmeMemoRadiSam system protein B
VAAGAVAFGVQVFWRDAAPVTFRESPVIPSRPEFFDSFLDADALLDAEKDVPADKIENRIRAVVVPHHLLAAKLIAHTLRMASGRPIRRVVIIGPNHDDLGGAALITADATWSTPYGDVRSDPEGVTSVIASTGAVRDAAVFVTEHSIGAIVPFVKKIFPEATIIPLVAASKAHRPEAESLAAWISGQSEDTLIVFSTDFSHYLTEPVARLRDAETLAAMENGDIDTILSWRSQHLDAPAVLATALLSSQKNGWNTSILDHANANDFLQVKAASITTYFTILMRGG